VLLCLSLAAAAVGALVYSVLREPVLSEAELRDLGVFVLPRPRAIGAFELESTRGGAFTAADLEGGWSFLFFGFTNCPDVCPTTMAVLAQAERELLASSPEDADRFTGVLVSVDPERDDVGTLGEYTAAFSPRFFGVTGPLEELAAFARQVNVGFGKVPAPEGSYGGYLVDHGAQIVIVNPRGHYHGFIRAPHRADTIVQTFQSLAARF
jgi:protein SCO1/2